MFTRTREFLSQRPAAKHGGDPTASSDEDGEATERHGAKKNIHIYRDDSTRTIRVSPSQSQMLNPPPKSASGSRMSGSSANTDSAVTTPRSEDDDDAGAGRTRFATTPTQTQAPVAGVSGRSSLSSSGRLSSSLSSSTSIERLTASTPSASSVSSSSSSSNIAIASAADDDHRPTLQRLTRSDPHHVRAANPGALNPISLSAGHVNANHTFAVSTPPPPLQPKPKDFKLITCLCSGSFGTVVLGELLQTHKLYAVKIIDKHLCIIKGQQRHVYAEKKCLQLLRSSPYINNLYWTMSDMKNLYLVLDYIPGGELLRRIAESNGEGLPKEDVVFYAAEVAWALHLMHTLKIVYRDVKPENILIDADGHICMVDFGFAFNDKDNMASTTMCGTPQYVPPELILGQGYDESGDWWGFGILIYEMLFARTPFDNKDKVSLYEQIVSKDPEFPEKADYESKDIITELLQKKKHERLGSGYLGFKLLKKAEFFAGVDWRLVSEKRLIAPWKPKLTSKLDFSRSKVTDSQSDNLHREIEGARSRLSEQLRNSGEVFADVDDVLTVLDNW